MRITHICLGGYYCNNSMFIAIEEKKYSHKYYNLYEKWKKLENERHRLVCYLSYEKNFLTNQ